MGTLSVMVGFLLMMILDVALGSGTTGSPSAPGHAFTTRARPAREARICALHRSQTRIRAPAPQHEIANFHTSSPPLGAHGGKLR